MRALAFLLLAAPAAAQAPALPLIVTPEAPASTATIANIRIERTNVFDLNVPNENWWIFRMANRIHFITKEQVVWRELLLGPGDPWKPLDVLESERNLRSLGIFRQAEIRPINRPDGKLDLSVKTQDSWTTNPEFSVGTEGGDNFLSYGFSEDNLLGYDKSIGFSRAQNGSRKRTELHYDDRRFMGSRFHLAPTYAITDRGDAIAATLTQPFFALETPQAGSLAWDRRVDETVMRKDAADFSKFLQRSQLVSASYGRRLEPDRFFTQRAEAGWYFQRDRFDSTGDTVFGTLPYDRELSGPSVGYSWVQPRYIKETYIDRMERVEDFNLGNELHAFGGFMGAATGSDRDRWIYNVIDQQGLFFMPGRFALAQAGASGRTVAGRSENELLFANINLFWKVEAALAQTWVGHLEVNRGRNLDLENQVILGGNTGLRGYKNYSFVGAKSVLLNIENRFFLPGEYFHLVRFGGAVFFDSGAVVPQTDGIGFNRFKSDIGFGFRMAPTRSQSGNIVRADVAYALNPGPGGSRFVVSIRGRQAFQIFNSSTRRVRQSPNSRLYIRPND